MGSAMAGASTGMQVGSTYLSYSAYKQQAANAKTIAAYNNKIDEQRAGQLAADDKANISTLRQQGAEYVSRQQVAYAAAGVASSGSALDVQATTAGRLEQKAQEMWRQSWAQQQRLYTAGQMGILEGNMQASQANLAAVGALMGGASNIMSSASSMYSAGAYK